MTEERPKILEGEEAAKSQTDRSPCIMYTMGKWAMRPLCFKDKYYCPTELLYGIIDFKESLEKRLEIGIPFNGGDEGKKVRRKKKVVRNTETIYVNLKGKYS